MIKCIAICLLHPQGYSSEVIPRTRCLCRYRRSAGSIFSVHIWVAKALSALFGLLCSAGPPVLWQGHDLVFFDILPIKNSMGDGLPLGLGPVPLFQVLSRAMLLPTRALEVPPGL